LLLFNGQVLAATILAVLRLLSRLASLRQLSPFMSAGFFLTLSSSFLLLTTALGLIRFALFVLLAVSTSLLLSTGTSDKISDNRTCGIYL